MLLKHIQPPFFFSDRAIAAVSLLLLECAACRQVNNALDRKVDGVNHPGEGSLQGVCPILNL